MEISPPKCTFSTHNNCVETRLCDFPPLNMSYKQTGHIFGNIFRILKKVRYFFHLAHVQVLFQVDIFRFKNRRNQEI